MSDISDIKIIINDRLELFKTELVKHNNFVDDKTRRSYTIKTDEIARIEKSVGESIEEVVNVVNQNIEYNIEVLNTLITKRIEEHYKKEAKADLDNMRDIVNLQLKNYKTGEEIYFSRAKILGLASLVLVSFVSAFYFFIWLYS